MNTPLNRFTQLSPQDRASLLKALQAGGGAMAGKSRAGAAEIPPNLIPAGCEHITPDMLTLVSLGPSEIAKIVRGVTGGAANVQDVYPLAPLQEGMLFHHLLSQHGDPFLEHNIVSFNSRERLDRYLAAVQATIDRHDILRTSLCWEGLPEPVQVVWRKAQLHVEEVTFDETGLDVEQALRRHIDAMGYRLDVRQAPTMRVYFALDRRKQRWIMLRFHHLLMEDATSIRLFHAEVRGHYEGRASELPEPVPFRNYVALVRLVLVQREYESFFTEMLQNVDEGTLPFGLADVYRDGRDVVDGRSALSPELTERLRRVARQLAVSPASLFHVAFGRMVGFLAGREDVVFGTVLFGRMQGVEGAERALGTFMNTLPIRVKLRDHGVRSAVHTMHRLLTQLLHFEHVPLAAVQRCSGVIPPRPLFSALLNYRNYAVGYQLSDEPDDDVEESAEGVRFLDYEERSNYPVMLNLDDLGSRFALSFQAPESIGPTRLCLYMETVVRDLVDALEAVPDAPVWSLRVVPEGERRALLAQWTGAEDSLPGPSRIHECFQAQVLRDPFAVALEKGQARITYGELNARTNRLAQYLRQCGVGVETLVSCCMGRQVELVVAWLAVLKCGAAYLPLDPQHPVQHLLATLEDAAPQFVLCSQDAPEIVRRTLESRVGVTLVDVQLDEARWSHLDAGDVRDEPGPLGSGTLAYVAYTSGSTGKPKGVMVDHASVVNLLEDMRRRLPFGPANALLALTTVSFDIAALEIWLPLVSGGRCVLADREQARDPQQIQQLLATGGIDVLQATPATWRMLLESGWTGRPGLKALCGGEALPLNLSASLRPLVDVLWNVYGPTETTIWSGARRIAGPVGAGAGSNEPFGGPLANTQFYVLDPLGEPVPEGVAGEIYIGGAGVARGYMNQPALTARRFVPDPFGNQPGARLYRTGDVGRCLPDGSIEFCGRTDHQVKVRGFRVELGAVEAALRACPGVRDAVVVARQEAGDETELVAYFASADGPSQGVAAASPADGLRALLAQRLPHYMVPVAFVHLEQLPLSANGKIDRRALPAPARAVPTDPVAPTREAELHIARMWCEVLNVPRVGLDDNFFDVGGHSLRLVQLHTRLVRHFGKSFPLVELLRCTTVSKQAHLLAPESRVGYARAGNTVGAATQGAPGLPGNEDIAIIGMSGRFADAGDLPSFWENLKAGHESIRALSPEHLRSLGLPMSVINDPLYVRASAGAVPDVDCFDARFFGFSAREAQLMDPQQRVFMQLAWHALEDAACDPLRYQGRIGVYAGQSLSQYLQRLMFHPRLLEEGSGFQLMISNYSDYLSTNVAYRLNLKGPAVTVQTACSSSLVAVHMACRSLLDGQCNVALAGGVTLNIQEAGYQYQPGGIQSPDGHCRAFDADAQGTIFGSGAGVVVLKRLSEALADGDPVRAVIKGSAINNDGARKIGFTAPSEDGQFEVIREAQAKARVSASSIGYVEAHGTGTALGDPVEVHALTRAFAMAGVAPQSCALGSVKSNIGHLDTAAGVAGLIKTVLSVEEGVIPPSINVTRPTPHVAWQSSPFFVNTALRSWGARDGLPRRAAVSSFGIGGTNAHVVIEEAPALPEWPQASLEDHLLVLSGKTPEALLEGAARLERHLSAHPEVDLADVSYTLQVGRAEFAHRSHVVANTAAEAVAGLAALRKQAGGRTAAERDPSVVFVFCGQGAQYVGMGRELYEREPVFAAAIDQCSELLKEHLKADLREVLYPNESSAQQAARASALEQTMLAQPALFAYQYAMSELWRSLGVTARGFVGHSLGELVAAHLAGVFSLEDVLWLVARRGALMQQMQPGSMSSVALGERALLALAREHRIGVELAAINAPELCTVAGSAESIKELEAVLSASGVAFKRIHASHAFHSACMDPMLAEFMEAVESVSPQAPRIPFISSLSGNWITAAQATDPKYWADQLRRTVRFADGLQQAARLDPALLLELGPSDGLTQLAEQQGLGVTAVASARGAGRPGTDRRHLIAAVGQLWQAGGVVHWSALHAERPRRRVRLPLYAFARERHWIDAAPAASSPAQEASPARSPMNEWFYEPSWRLSRRKVASLPPIGGQSWLLFVDSVGLGDGLRSLLGDNGADVVTVAAATRFVRVGAASFEVDPGNATHYEQLLAELTAQGRAPGHVVHLWGVRGESSMPAAARYAESQALGFDSILLLAQALESAGLLSRAMHLGVITSRLYAIESTDPRPCPERATVVGPCFTLPAEYRTLRSTCVDVAWPGDASQLRALSENVLAEILAPKESLVAYRAKHRWVRHFDPVSAPLPDGPSTRLREGGVYLITGGLGGIGLVLAEHLARQYRAKLVLTSRTALPAPEQQADEAIRNRWDKIHRLESLGAEVMVVAADASEFETMRQAVAEVYQRFGTLHGVIHAAGLPGVGVVALKTREQAASVQAAKVKGTLVLDTLLKDASLDFLMLCSSVTALSGVPGQVDYCAANAFMDAYSQAHVGEEPFTISVNWSAWQKVGMAVNTAVPTGLQAERAATIAQGIEPSEGIEAFTRLLELDIPQVVVSPSRIQAQAYAGDSQPSSLVIRDAPVVAAHPRPNLDNPYVPPTNDIEMAIVELWKSFLGLQQVGIDDNFFELGGHSLLAIQVSSQLGKTFGVSLTAAQVIEAATPAALARTIVQALLGPIDGTDVRMIEALLVEADVTPPPAS